MFVHFFVGSIVFLPPPPPKKKCMSCTNEIGVFFHIYKGKTTDKGTKNMGIKNALK